MSHIAIIKSGWHAAIVDRFESACVDHLAECAPGLTCHSYRVTGVVEIPLAARRCAESGRFAAIVAAALIADHGIYRHEFVAQAVLDGCMQVQQEWNTPVIYGVLTPQDFMSEGRTAYFNDHFVKKGQEAAEACQSMLATLEQIAELR